MKRWRRWRGRVSVARMYELLLAIHILAAVVWVGGSVALTLLGRRVAPAERQIIAPHFSWYGGRVITGAAVVLILAGIGLVLELDHVGFGDLWIVLAIVGWIVSAVLGGAVLGPLGEKLESASGPEEADALFSRLMRVQYVDTLIVVLVVIDMAVKPGG